MRLAATLLLLGLAACSHKGFHYESAAPVLTPAKKWSAPDAITVEAEEYGFMWSSCESVNRAAMEKLTSAARERRYDVLSKLEWYDHWSDRWERQPRCRTEYGWLLGSIYTVWWYEATKVRVRARAMRAKTLAPSLASVDEPFAARTYGKQTKSSAELRAKSNGSFELGLPLVPLLPVADVGLLRPVSEDEQVHLRFEVWAMDVGYATSGRDIPSGATLSIANRKFFGNSFFVGAGVGVERRNYEEYEGPFRTPEAKLRAWREQALGGTVSLGNEWRTDSGVIIGGEWLGAFAPVAHLGTEGDDGDPASHRYRTRVRVRGPTLRLGISL